uniref:Uncharacterized protein n=1 Tax=Oryza glaberrima TaxID=4538 RepID=A0A679BDT2_ORYGL|nr:hypothetical protein [Oryza glaberrima]
MTPDWPLSSTTLPLPSPSLNTHAPVSARMSSCLVEGGQQSNPSEMGWNPDTREPQRCHKAWRELMPLVTTHQQQQQEKRRSNNQESRQQRFISSNPRTQLLNAQLFSICEDPYSCRQQVSVLSPVHLAIPKCGSGNAAGTVNFQSRGLPFSCKDHCDTIMSVDSVLA